MRWDSVLEKLAGIDREATKESVDSDGFFSSGFLDTIFNILEIKALNKKKITDAKDKFLENFYQRQWIEDEMILEAQKLDREIKRRRVQVHETPTTGGLPPLFAAHAERMKKDIDRSELRYWEIEELQNFEDFLRLKLQRIMEKSKIQPPPRQSESEFVRAGIEKLMKDDRHDEEIIKWTVEQGCDENLAKKRVAELRWKFNSGRDRS